MSNAQIGHIEETWKQKTVASNALFDQGSYVAARNGYTEAIVAAETLNVNGAEALRAGIPLIQIFVISCNNLANTLEELGQLGEAEKILKRALYFLLGRYRTKAKDPSEIGSELTRAYLNYVNFVEKHQIDGSGQDEVVGSIKEALMTKKTWKPYC